MTTNDAGWSAAPPPFILLASGPARGTAAQEAIIEMTLCSTAPAFVVTIGHVPYGLVPGETDPREPEGS